MGWGAGVSDCFTMNPKLKLNIFFFGGGAGGGDRWMDRRTGPNKFACDGGGG